MKRGTKILTEVYCHLVFLCLNNARQKVSENLFNCQNGFFDSWNSHENVIETLYICICNKPKISSHLSWQNALNTFLYKVVDVDVCNHDKTDECTFLFRLLISIRSTGLLLLFFCYFAFVIMCKDSSFRDTFLIKTNAYSIILTLTLYGNSNG